MTAPLPQAAFSATAAALAAAVLLHASWMPGWFVALLLLIVGLRLLQRRFRPKRVHWLVRLLLMIGLLVAIGTAFWSPSAQQPLFAALLASMLTLKMIETETSRDARLVLAFACFLAMTGFLFDQGPAQSVMTAVAVVLIFAALHALVPGSTGVRPLQALRSSFASAGLLTALALPFALVVFLAFPRLDRPLWGGLDEQRQGRTGISDRLEPGQLTSLSLDDSPAMRVVFDGPVPEVRHRYFRGLVFWWFDGRGWSGTDVQRGFSNDIDIRPLQTPIGYEVTLEPTDQRWLFTLDAPVERPSIGWLTPELQAQRRGAITSPLTYRARSALTYALQPDLELLPRQMAMRRPAGNPRTLALGQQWRALHPDDDQAVINEALSLFNREFSYSLDPPPLAAAPVDDFLFGSKIGYCEHFASAFAVLMRAARIPARVVVGYQGGFVNAAGGYLTVRRSDAHAWTEVWLAGRGWVRVDPTAAVAPERIERGADAVRGASPGLLAGEWGVAWRDRWDLVGAWWNRAIVGFNALRQRAFFSDLGLPDAGWQELGLVLVIGGLGAMALAVLLGLRGRRGPRDPVLAAWRRVCVRLARAGVARAASEGPTQYAERVATQLPAHAAAMRALTRRFVALRYAGSANEVDSVRTFGRAAAAFRPRRAATTRSQRAS